MNPFTDIGFKIIFGQPASKPFLITLLNELLAGEHRIEDLMFLDKEDHAEHVRDKGIIYDLYCRTSTGEYIIVEMQNRKHLNFVDRTLYYMCRAVSRQIEAPLAVEVHSPDDGEEGLEVREPSMSYGAIYKLHTVYGVFFMNFKEPDLPDRFRVDSGILDLESHETLNPHFRQIYLQFPYFTKELDECETLLERLFYALKNMEHWIRMPDALKEQVFAHLSRLAAVANLSPENRLASLQCQPSCGRDFLAGSRGSKRESDSGSKGEWDEGRPGGRLEGRSGERSPIREICYRQEFKRVGGI